MKTIFCSMVICLLATGISCSQDKSVYKAVTTENDGKYEYLAEFNEKRSDEVVAYIDKVLSKNNNISFKNTQLDSKMTLNDKTTFYIKLSPGVVQLKFRKADNTESNYKKLKSLCKDLDYKLKNHKNS